MEPYSPPTAELHVAGQAQRFMVRPAADLPYVEVSRAIAEDRDKLELWCAEHAAVLRKKLADEKKGK